MGLNRKKGTAILLAAVLCLLVPLGALAGVRAVDTEENGKLKQTEWVDDAGKPAAGPDGYSAVIYSTKKDAVVEMYFGVDGKPYETEGGYYGRAVTKDLKGRVIQVEYLDETGARTLNSRGYCLMTIGYFGFGEIRSVTYYGMNKKPVTVPSLGYAQMTCEYSGTTLTARTYKNGKGKPVDSVEGYAAVKQKLNKQHQVLRIRYEHADGSPATGPDGWYRCIKDRDEKGRVISVKYYDEQEQLIDRGAGYAWEEMEYEGDNLVKITRYDLQGGKVTDEAGVATLVRQMKDDRVQRESFLDKEGKQILNSLGVGAVVYSYDHLGRIETVSYLGLDGAPANCRFGYAGYRDTRDEDGATISRTFLGTDGMPTEIPAGYSEIRYVYDETKNLTATRYFNISGGQVQATE